MTEKVKKPYKSAKPAKHKEESTATLTEEITAVLEEIKEEPVKEKKKGEIVTLVDEVHVTIGERQYLLVKNHREAFDGERLGERFSDVLSRYDYIVGDWGYDQLRLKGFFKESNRKAAPEQRIDTLEDYLYEYCNFGCAYFVIERVGGKREKQQMRRKKPNKKPVHQNQAHTDEKRVPMNNKTKPVIKNRKENEPQKAVVGKSKNNTAKGRSFTIRQREE
ncbi:YutD family protein [Enterococcus caccae]|uniref:Transcriptional regulator n=1 Tax=Enterococcus caccae ATCC BAA-1240 TaxID=1158612 RepID=R3WVU7_9ENTE|nr:YutD family protein [Enterococcus caccae]EOL45920.1 hypothetical protein UC7_01717 [Enterococcus caccae ATCC BAA-1240]EOT61116.1 hypothetical protein I580_02018 [Enterococcus caccae ATCC BAA-1240]OJG27853.1 hypothetical protein RU98_GL002062 [Enterococcus caccae]